MSNSAIVPYLQIAYPIMVGIWVVASLALNERAARHPRPYSLKLPVDDRLPFIPVFVFFYFSAYLLGNASYLLLFAHPIFPKVFSGYLALFGVGVTCYFLFPCRVERREALAPTTIPTQLLVAFQQKLKPYNSFPSMHVAFCLFSALMIIMSGAIWLGIFCLGWAGLIALSTLLTKQHHLLDVAAGAVLATSVVLALR